MNSDLIAERIEYGDRALSRSDLGDCPLKLARQWLEEATREGIPEANGVCLSTVSRDGCPDSRVVLVKEFDSAGPIFYTNYEGRKGKQLEAEPRAGMVFWWQSLRRQVRLSGQVEKVSGECSDAYFATRPREAQLGAWASLQSRPMESRRELDERLAEVAKRFPDEVPRPPHWGGYRLLPQRVEFWQGRNSRLHDRFVFEKNGRDWSVQRLMP